MTTTEWICRGTGKVIYETRGDARKALRDIKHRQRRHQGMRGGTGSSKLEVYQCNREKHFHLGGSGW